MELAHFRAPAPGRPGGWNLVHFVDFATPVLPRALDLLEKAICYRILKPLTTCVHHVLFGNHRTESLKQIAGRLPPKGPSRGGFQLTAIATERVNFN